MGNLIRKHVGKDDWLAYLSLFGIAVGLLLVGILIGKSDPSNETVRTVEVTVPVYSGDFEDVKLRMESSMGNAFTYECDMHFTPDPDDEHTAECEYIP